MSKLKNQSRKPAKSVRGRKTTSRFEAGQLLGKTSRSLEEVARFPDLETPQFGTPIVPPEAPELGAAKGPGPFADYSDESPTPAIEAPAGQKDAAAFKLRQAAKSPSFSEAISSFGTGARGPGRKDDRGKLRVDLIPAEVIEALHAFARPLPVGLSPRKLAQDALARLAAWRLRGDLEDLTVAFQLCLQIEAPSRDSISAGGLEAIANVLEFGAFRGGKDGTGYGEDNWAGVPEARRRYYAAAERHLLAWLQGRTADPESGLGDPAHAGCCAAFLIALQVRGAL